MYSCVVIAVSLVNTLLAPYTPSSAPPLTDRTHVVETQPDCTVADVKAIIEAREGECVCVCARVMCVAAPLGWLLSFGGGKRWS
jgi:hypothetical protein